MNLIGILFLIFLTKESCGNSLPCTDNANCTTIVATASCAPGGYCQCPAGYVFTTDFTQCIAEVLYGVQCTDGVQCSHMLTGAYCDATNVCSCRNEFTYVRGRCRKLVDLGKTCNEDIDCNYNFDRDSVKCNNNVCTCTDGFYLRTKNVCRRISMKNGDPCIVNTDCQGTNSVCNETSNACVSTVGIQTELYSLPKTKSVSIQVDDFWAPITAEVNPQEKDDVVNATFGDVCPNERDECTGLAHSICQNGLCHCKPGYYLQSQQCKAEIGEPAVSKDYCVGLQPTVDYRDGKCVCGLNLFNSANLKSCIKASTGYGNGCTQNSQCTPYGPAYCTTVSPKICQCYPYADYDVKTQLCVHKIGYEEYCTSSNQCQLKNTICSNENTCVCAPKYLAIEKVCAPGEGAECATTNECGYQNAECVDNVDASTPEKYCKCKPGFLYYKSECIPEVQHDEECDVDEQCKPLLGELSECKEQKCLCKDGAHFKDDKCHTKTKIGEECTKSSECYVEQNPERVACRNSVCNCKFDYTADVEKQQCIVIKAAKKNSSGRPSPFKVITIILMTSAALITSAAIREAYFLR